MFWSLVLVIHYLMNTIEVTGYASFFKVGFAYLPSYLLIVWRGANAWVEARRSHCLSSVTLHMFLVAESLPTPGAHVSVFLRHAPGIHLPQLPSELGVIGVWRCQACVAAGGPSSRPHL